MRKPHILCFDAWNFIHRARSGFSQGEYPVVFNFFRSLRAEVEKHKPTRVVLVKEGAPRRQLLLDNTYKANRVVKEHEPLYRELQDFHRQKTIILDILEKYFPVSVVHHSDFEADDTIYNIIRRSTSSVPWTVVSTDSDFIQLLNEFDNVKLYNPVKKEYVVAPSYDYVIWKALRGDKTDNIEGVPGIGDKKAEKLVNDLALLEESICSIDAQRKVFERNVEMIKFTPFTEADYAGVISNVPIARWEIVKASFASMQFQSMLIDKTWNKFVATFDALDNPMFAQEQS